ncbi:MAG: NAD-dependent epimerase/dehydratase family protein [bacterium]
MRILVLGGTRFLGRHLVHAALARGHALTLLHRGRSDASAFPEAEHLIADREGDLGVLAGRTWDAVVDPSGYRPGVVAASARALAGAVGRYLFVSTISVHAKPLMPGADEHAPRIRLADPGVSDGTPEAYGGLKALCEDEVAAVFGARATVVRPGLIVGPHDTTDRFPYWPRRLARGGEVLAPGRPEAPVQMVDARDLAAWMLDLLERDRAGTFNAVGPERPFTMAEALTHIAAGVGVDPALTWVDEAFLLAHEVVPWVGLPLWVPAADDAFVRMSNARALAEGLRTRPLAATARDTLQWERSLAPGARPTSPVLSAEREREVLAAWHARSG